MRKQSTLRCKTIVAAGMVAALCAPAMANAAPSVVQFYVGQDGYGSVTSLDGYTQGISASVGNDPGPGGSAAALIYDLAIPPDLTYGDVLVNNQAGQLAEVLRFEAAAGTCTGGCLVLYSAVGSGTAGSGTTLPSSFLSDTITVSLTSQGTVSYTPSAGQPGYISVGVSYAAAVPEPTTAGLFLMGTLAAGAMARRRRS